MRYTIFLFLAFAFAACNHPETVKDNADQSRMIDSATRMQADILQELNVYPQNAEQDADRLLSICEKSGYRKGCADAHADKGDINLAHNNAPVAMEEYMNAIMIYDSLHIDSSTARCNYNMATIYLMQGDGAHAIQPAQAALAVHQSLGMQRAVFADHFLIGQIDLSLQHYATARTEFTSALQSARELNDSMKVARALAGIGSAYTADGQSDKGLEFHLAAEKAFENAQTGGYESKQDKAFPSQLMLDMAGEYFLNNDYAQAIKEAQEGLLIAQDAGLREQQCTAYQKLGELYGLTGREDIQLQYNEKYNLLHDTIEELNSTERLSEIMSKYESLKKDNEEQLQKAELEKAQVEEELQSAKTNLILAQGGMVILILIVAGLIIYYNRR